AGLIGTLVLGLGINLSPCYLYQWKQGPNPAVAHRGRFEAEIYGLKVTQLFLPVTGHRLHFLRTIKDKYNNDPYPLVNDFGSSPGMVGSLGYLFLLAFFLLG